MCECITKLNIIYNIFPVYHQLSMGGAFYMPTHSTVTDNDILHVYDKLKIIQAYLVTLYGLYYEGILNIGVNIFDYCKYSCTIL